MLIEIKKAYGGQEGKRVRVGDRFWVDKPGGKKCPDGLRSMTLTRFRQLEQQKIAAPVAAAVPGAKVEPASKPARPHREPTPARSPAAPGAKVEPDSGSRPGATERQTSKAKEPAPQSPRNGGPKAGKGATSSSSQADPQTGASTLKQRGTRRGQVSAGSPSTTPTDSSPGPTSSTPATPDGGDTTTDAEISEAFA